MGYSCCLRAVCLCVTVITSIIAQSAIEISQNNIECSPMNSSMTFVENDPVVARSTDGTYLKAVVTAVKEYGNYEVLYVGTSSKGVTQDVRSADICSCYLNKGQCEKYVAGNRGIGCKCGWSQDLGSVCAFNSSWDSAELDIAIRLCPYVSSDAQAMKDSMNDNGGGGANPMVAAIVGGVWGFLCLCFIGYVIRNRKKQVRVRSKI